MPPIGTVPQTVLVTAVDDGVTEGTQEAYISHIIDTNDPDYQEAFALQELVVIREAATATVMDRRIFYNNSRFDGNDPAAAVADDGAIAPSPSELLDIGEDAALGKTALLPGQTATFQNYTSYDAGINGIMVDVAGLAQPELVSAADFEFRVGNDNSPSGWQLVTADAQVSVRAGAGVDGSDRITIIWPGGSISQQWLQVRLKANVRTGLVQDEVHYWGNAIAESGDYAGNTYVNAGDEIAARHDPHGRFTPAAIFNPHDYDRDTYVNAVDEILARHHPAGRFTSLKLIAPPLE